MAEEKEGVPSEENKGNFSYEILQEGEEIILRIDCSNWLMLPSLEDNPICMAKTIEILEGVSEVTKITYFQKRDYEYDYYQTQIILEIARLHNLFSRQRNIFSYAALNFEGKCAFGLDDRYREIQYIIFRLMKSDPLGAYVEAKRAERREKIALEKEIDPKNRMCIQKYIGVLEYIISQFEKTRLIILTKAYLPGYELGNRDIYRKVFAATIKPDFMFTKLMATMPADGIEIDSYTIGKNTDVTIFKFPDNVQYLYHIVPPEFKLSEEKYEILDNARKILAEHQPRKSEFTEPERMRSVFLNVGKDLIEELCRLRGVELNVEEIEELAEILVRYTVGFGLIEVLLQDENIQDISINSPMGQIPIFIVHGVWFDCRTNIIPTSTEAESWASKLRLVSGRPLDEANPILDTELRLPGANTRVSAITEPLDPTGIAFSFRRHRDKPWTLPLFIKNKMITPLAAGLISFLVDGTRTMLICGTRSSGKSSFLSSIMLEIMRRYRIITIEDTLELPTDSFRKIGFNIQPMKVASAFSHGGGEISASDGIRSTLRLGDSSIVIGEVRSKEAIALYEAMRVGAAANVVAGTIHGDSPYGIYDRVVNDIGVPKTSFKATDIIIVANPIKSADGLHRFRRITQITEVRKTWENDPMLEGGFLDLMKYDAIKDELVPMPELITGESEVLKAIAGNYPDFAGNWDAVWKNIELRAKCKKAIVDYSIQNNDPDMLEAEFCLSCNDRMHIIMEEVKEQTGKLDPDEVYRRYDLWLRREVKKRALSKSSGLVE